VIGNGYPGKKMFVNAQNVRPLTGKKKMMTSKEKAYSLINIYPKRIRII